MSLIFPAPWMTTPTPFGRLGAINQQFGGVGDALLNELMAIFSEPRRGRPAIWRLSSEGQGFPVFSRVRLRRLDDG
ncbi:MAG: hypothetical protein R3B96_24030 [Pirellulaceae bacterium]